MIDEAESSQADDIVEAKKPRADAAEIDSYVKEIILLKAALGEANARLENLRGKKLPSRMKRRALVKMVKKRVMRSNQTMPKRAMRGVMILAMMIFSIRVLSQATSLLLFSKRISRRIEMPFARPQVPRSKH